MTSKQLSAGEADAFGRELDALRLETLADLGQRDVDHIRRIIRIARYAEVGGRVMLHVGLGPLSFVLGVSALGLSKILENMEVGHNVMHGQYDWTGAPALDSRTYEWDHLCTGDDWRHSHNFEHHTFTNVIGRDRDVGYGFLRVTNAQRWYPQHVLQPLAALILAVMFEWGVALHDMRIDETLVGRQPLAVLRRRARPFVRKAACQLAKEYVALPVIALWNAPRVLAGNLLANALRNVWSFSVIFCGHFPDGVRVYTVAETENEARGEWYLRQLNGSANIDGGRLFHIMTGHLSHQIEHHLFPDLPASRYPELAPKVRALCERYGQQYNTGTFVRQLTSVARSLIANAIPPRLRGAS
jgi:linoleoyl-CoA desaturase